MLPRGVAIRAGAASGIIPFGTTAEAWGAATALGPDRTGNARLILDPGKHGLELSRDGSPCESRGRSAGRRARLRKWRAAAPGYQRAATFCWCRAANGWHCAFRRFASLFSAHDLARKPGATFRDHACAGGEFIFGAWSSAELGRVGVARTVLLVRHCERQRSNPDGLRRKLDCFVVSLLAMTRPSRRKSLGYSLRATLSSTCATEPEPDRPNEKDSSMSSGFCLK